MGQQVKAVFKHVISQIDKCVRSWKRLAQADAAVTRGLDGDLFFSHA